MFKAVDSAGQEIFLKDKVTYSEQAGLMGEMETVTGHVIAIPSETDVEVQPELGGIPTVHPSDSVTVVESLVAQVLDLHTNDELQQLLLFAEKRHEEAVAGQKKRRSSGGTRKARTDTTVDEFD